MFSKPFFQFASEQGKLTNYEILEVHHNCTQRQIKHNYLRLAKIFHPDVYKGKDVERFKSIQEAYQILKSPERRRNYDLSMNLYPSNKSSAQETDQTDNPQNGNQEQDYTQEQEKNENGFKFRDYKSKSDGARPEDYIDEYQKFMNRPMETDPGNIWVYENIFMRQQTKQYKAQLQYMYTKVNPYEHMVKTAHVQGYDKQVKDFITDSNEFQDKLRAITPEKIEKKIVRRIKWKKFVAFSFLAMCVPFVQSGLDRRFKVYRWMDDEYKQQKEQQEEEQVNETQSRFVY